MKNGNEYAVVCREIEKWFGEGEARVQALRGVDLEIRMGELAMLAGRAVAERPPSSPSSPDSSTAAAVNWRC